MVLNRVNGGDASITRDRISQCSKLNVTWSMYSEGKKNDSWKEQIVLCFGVVHRCPRGMATIQNKGVALT